MGVSSPHLRQRIARPKHTLLPSHHWRTIVEIVALLMGEFEDAHERAGGFGAGLCGIGGVGWGILVGGEDVGTYYWGWEIGLASGVGELAQLWENGAWYEVITGVSVLYPAEVLGPVSWGWLDWRCVWRIVPLLDSRRFSDHSGNGLTAVVALRVSHHYFEGLFLLVYLTVDSPRSVRFDRSWAMYGGGV